MSTEKRRRQVAEATKRYKLTAKGKASQKKYYASDAKREANRRWMKLNREKHAVHQMVYVAIKNGRLKRGNCEVCGKERAFAHHDDYSKPLDVRWLCNYHHSEHHRIEA
jgi:RNA polymerase-binding transcription factor DksA